MKDKFFQIFFVLHRQYYNNLWSNFSCENPKDESSEIEVNTIICFNIIVKFSIRKGKFFFLSKYVEITV